MYVTVPKHQCHRLCTRLHQAAVCSSSHCWYAFSNLAIYQLCTVMIDAGMLPRVHENADKDGVSTWPDKMCANFTLHAWLKYGSSCVLSIDCLGFNRSMLPV
jgi:hypothetical protein